MLLCVVQTLATPPALPAPLPNCLLLCVLLCGQSMAELKLASMPPTLSMQMHSTPNEPHTELRPQTGTRPEARTWSVFLSPSLSLQPGCRISSQFENFILIFQITFSHITQKHYCLFVCLSQSLSRSAELLPQKFNKTAKDAHKEQNMIKTTVRYKRVLRKRNK